MAVPDYRNPIRPARGTFAALSDAANQAEFGSFELLHAIDQGKLYIWNGSALIEVASAEQDLSGKADLDGNGKVLTSQLPNLAISEFLGEVNSEAALLALSGQRGDWAIRSDEGKTYILVADGGALLSDWRAISTPADAVTSVNGQTGVVVLTKADVGLGNVDNTSDADKPISTATQAALDLKAPLASPALTGTPTAPTAATGTNSTQLATTAFVQAEIDAQGFIPEAPSDGKAYVRVNGAWALLTDVLTTLGDNNTVTV